MARGGQGGLTAVDPVSQAAGRPACADSDSSVRCYRAAWLWLKLSLKGAPDQLQEVTRYAKCVPCLTDRKVKIGGPSLELTRDPPTGDPLPLPTERQWKDRMRWQRR